MSRKRASQKLVSFSDSKQDLDKIRQDMKAGWTLISLIQNGNYYMGVMEETVNNNNFSSSKPSVFIPPRKKIKITY
ncbi:MAG: DUF2674 domain-containing protein [Rickettsiaceae bacterium]|nr:MAG: DUF2674 domain-containing protein [Rickettsiaceae bacterium]